MAKTYFVRRFVSADGKYLAVFQHNKGHELFLLDGDIVTLDVPPVEFKNYKGFVKHIFKDIIKGADISLVQGEVTTFDGVREIVVKGFTGFEMPKLPSGIKLVLSTGNFGVVKRRKFDYDFTNPEIAAIKEEMNARLKYYVKPPYFKFLELNVSNSFIKGMALIGKPGTGKSTDAIAVVNQLGGIILITQLSGGMLENNVFTNTKPNRVLTDAINKISDGVALTSDELEQYELLAKSSSSFIEVEETIIRAIRLNCPVLLDEFAYANILLKARFNVLTDGTAVFRHEGVDYPLPPNFFIFMTWNPGDDGTSDIPKALKSRFPVFIVPGIDKITHRERIISFVNSELSLKSIDTKFVDALYEFGNLVEANQNELRHYGGSFTIRATQMFLSNVMCSTHTRDEFVYELKSKFVNPLWGTNFENTELIEEKLRDHRYSGRVTELYDQYKLLFPEVSSSEPTYSLGSALKAFAAIAPEDVSAAKTGTGLSEDWVNDISQAFDE